MRLQDTYFGRGAALKVAFAANIDIINHQRAKRARVGVRAGDRGAAGAACGPVMLEPVRDAKQPMTAMARRKLPKVLARLDPLHHRRQFAAEFADAYERLGSVAGSGDLGGSGGGGVSDGGVAARMDYATIIHKVEGAVNGWAIAPGSGGRYLRGKPIAVLTPKTKRGERRPILAFDLLRRICVDGEDMVAILRAHGWTGHARDVQRLMRIADFLLDMGQKALVRRFDT